MSYTSEAKLPKRAPLIRVREVVELLGYRKVNDGLRVPDRVGSYFWSDEEEYRSWTGVELDLYERRGRVTVTTRSRAGRSYWDLLHQNKTLKLIRDLFGGHFTTDAGRNRYWRPDEPPPTPLASGCFIARWKFHNALISAKLYMQARNLEGALARDKATGFGYLDKMNPRLLSNNLLVPYIIAVWEDYFRSTFAAVLKYADRREAVLKKARLSHAQLEQIAGNHMPIEQAIAECYSFQRPSQIGTTFKLVDTHLDFAAAMRRPNEQRTVTLYDSIEELVENRNAFVHAGKLDLRLFDRELEKTLSDIVEAVDRCYMELGAHFGFVPIQDY